MKRPEVSHLNFSRNQSLLLLSLLYLLVSLCLFNKYGIKIMNDSPRYFSYAENLSSQGIYFDPLNFWYISYVFFVYVNQLIDQSYWIIILNQYVLGYCAMLALCLGVKRLTESWNTAFLAGVIFIFFPDNLNWHSYILTESFYGSMLCIAFYLLVRLSQESERWLLYFIAGFILLLCFFTKPTSPALFIALAFPFVWKWLIKPPHRLAKFSSMLIVGVLMFFLANKMISAHSVMLIYENGDIIFAMHSLPDHLHHDLMTIEVPENLQEPDIDQPLLQQMAEFVLDYPIYYLKLMIGKIIMYVTHVRPYWSWPHNIVVALFLWPLYVFSYRAIKRGLVSNYIATAAVVYLIIHTGIISITWADWDGRFFVPIIPLVIFLGTIGLKDYIQKRIQKT